MGRKRIHNKHLPERMVLKSGAYYYLQPSGPRKNKWVSLGRNYGEALRQYAKIVDVDSPIYTMGDLIARYLQQEAPKKAPRTHKNNIAEARYLREVFSAMRPHEITPQDIYAYLDKRGKKAPVSANREIALLSHMFKKAIRWGVLSENPCIGIEKHKEEPRKRYVTDDEFYAFRFYAGPTIAAYMDIKYLTALRKGDILRLKLGDIKDDGIHVHISKTNDDRIISWSPALDQAVKDAKALRRRVGSIYLFCTRDGQPYVKEDSNTSGWDSIWQRKMRKAVNPENGVLAERFHDHDIRAKSACDIGEGRDPSELLVNDPKTAKKYYSNRRAIRIAPLK